MREGLTLHGHQVAVEKVWVGLVLSYGPIQSSKEL